MYHQNSLLEIPNYEEYLIFYKIMNYPIPIFSEFFLFQKPLNPDSYQHIISEKFSRHQTNPFMHEYISYINKFGWLYKSLPFIKAIYLCNSITFNAVKKDSDIDLFIITKKNALWRARFFSVLFFWILGLKRTLNKKTKKFCLSFYITEEADNLYNITLPKTDIYFSYRLAHLVPLYQEQEYNIYQSNKRLVSDLPNFPQKHSIFIGTKLFKGKSKTKKMIEYFFGGILGEIIEKIIKIIRLPIVLYKKKKYQEDGWGIIIGKNILKFHLDIRKKVRLNYILRKKGIHKNIYGIHE